MEKNGFGRIRIFVVFPPGVSNERLGLFDAPLRLLFSFRMPLQSVPKSRKDPNPPMLDSPSNHSIARWLAPFQSNEQSITIIFPFILQLPYYKEVYSVWGFIRALFKKRSKLGASSSMFQLAWKLSLASRGIPYFQFLFWVPRPF